MASPQPRCGPAAGVAHVPAFATTADVVELVAEAIGLPDAPSLRAMRAVSRVWRGAVASTVRRWGRAEGESWEDASRLCSYAHAVPRVARTCVVAGAGEWLAELPAVLGDQPRLPAIVVANPFFSALRRAPHVTSLSYDARGHLATPGVVEAVTAALGPTVRKLALRGVKLSQQTDLSALPPALTSFTFSAMVDAGVDGEAVIRTLLDSDHGPRLTQLELSLRTPSFKPALGRATITRIAERCASLERILVVADGAPLRRVFADCPKLADIAVANDRMIDDASLAVMATACTNLRRFAIHSFAGANVTKTGLLHVASSATGPALAALSLGQLARGVTLADVQEVVAVGMTGLRELRLEGIDAGDQTELCQFSKLLPHLHTFSVQGARPSFSALNFVRFTRAAANLTDLDLGACVLVGDGALAALGANCPRLRHLQLHSVVGGTSDAGMEALVARGCGELRDLGMTVADACPGITDAGVRAVCSRSPHLQRFHLTGKVRLASGTLDALARHCPHLVELGCTAGYDGAAITADALAAFAARMPHVVVKAKRPLGRR